MSVLVPEEKQIIKQNFSLATLVLLFGQYSSEALIIQHSQGENTPTLISYLSQLLPMWPWANCIYLFEFWFSTSLSRFDNTLQYYWED